MMKVTKTTHGTLAANRREKSGAIVQRRLKDGTWGKPQKVITIGNETPEQTAERLTKINNCEYRAVR